LYITSAIYNTDNHEGLHRAVLDHLLAAYARYRRATVDHWNPIEAAVARRDLEQLNEIWVTRGKEPFPDASFMSGGAAQ
jgi:hypothetical protein